jgi:hypothetical protein
MINIKIDNILINIILEWKYIHFLFKMINNLIIIWYINNFLLKLFLEIVINKRIF